MILLSRCYHLAAISAFFLGSIEAQAQCRSGGGGPMQFYLQQQQLQQNMLRSAPGGQNALLADLMQQNALLQSALQQQNALRAAGQTGGAQTNVLVAGGRQQVDMQRLDQQAEDLFANPARHGGRVVRLVGTATNLQGLEADLETSAGTVTVVFRERPTKLSRLIDQQPDAMVLIEGTVRFKQGQPTLTNARAVRSVAAQDQARQRVP